MRNQKVNKEVHRKPKFGRKDPQSCKSVSLQTHPVTLQNLLIQGSEHNNHEDQVISMISDLITSNKKLGFIPLINNISNQYISLVEACQTAPSVKDEYEPLYCHIPAKEEQADLLWGLEKVISYRLDSEDKASFINNPVMILIDSDVLIKSKTVPLIHYFLENGPKVGVFFIIAGTYSKNYENLIEKKISFSSIKENSISAA